MTKSYSIRVYSLDEFSWTEAFHTEDFDDALAEWHGECEENPDRKVELVEETIIEVQEK